MDEYVEVDPHTAILGLLKQAVAMNGLLIPAAGFSL
jgi:hypothetical protein